MPFSLSDGFSPEQRDKATELFWQAFKGKLALVMKPEDKALRFLSSVIDPQHAISASNADGELLGIAGFKTEAGAFVGGGLRDICKVYGLFGGIWRGTLLSVMERPLEPDTLLMDGIFVSAEARGRGIGTALLLAIKAKAQSLGHTQVRLDVIDTNPRAQELYRRQGFVAGETTDIGPLRHIFGFQKATMMTYRVQEQ